ncbi:hypothetical protein PSU4_44960 [Pseudonocardia sulfidoxydans NBRC 16205]|uniref:Lipoprotein n=1 Tax=Pseudonocardia sulfidoxydans NBRC 16205 TaxID=1223511 RepID=A0A511DL48_9PSEU|nr:hypothetical protein [Pseudonocardia sulfidoxydans]GEL25542.1 hypothetical protein PSU4_44960 [Pseudonocardia sulfidoxydans NBRC 16205]
MRAAQKTLLVVPALILTASATACSTSTAGTPATTALATATIDVVTDGRMATRVGTHTITATTSADVNRCVSDAGRAILSFGPADAPSETIERLDIEAPVGDGPGKVRMTWNSTKGGSGYGTDYTASDGRSGKATVSAAVRDGRLEITFDATTWDQAHYRGTASCALT